MDELHSMPNQWERELARLREENESLRARLEDSQETLRAIQDGAVDALVIDTPEGPRVFTLQGGEHPYRALIEQMREGAATLTPEGVIHYCNQRCAEMFKLPLERVTGGRMEDFVAPADRAALASILREGAGRTELVLRAHDATEVPALVSAISLRAEGPAAVCLVVTDLTERKRHEAEIHQLNEELEKRVVQRTAQLAAAKDLYAVTLASIGDGVIVTDVQGRVTFLNREAEHLTGWTSGEAEGHPLPAVFHIINEQTRQPVENPVEKVFRLEIVVGLADHTILIAKDGREIPIDHSGALIRQSDGTVQGVVLVLRDFTEQKQAEEALRESEQRFRRLSEANIIGIITADMNAITSANDEFLRLIGYSRKDLEAGRIDWQQVTPLEFASRDQNALAQLKQRGWSEPFEKEYVRKDGSRVPILIGASLLTREPVAWICFVLDLTERKRAEQVLKTLNETLEQRIAERTKAVQMLHDIATMANQSQNTEQAIEYCLRRVAMHNGWCFGHALLPDTDNPDELVPAYAYYAEDPERVCRFREVTFGLRLRRGQGLPGRVLASGKLEWTTDLRGDLIERRALVAEELGIGAAVAFPVLLGDRVAAVLEFFSDQVIQPDSRIADALVGVGLQLGRVIERAEFEEHLLTIAEEIQRGISQDLHDDVGQELTGLGLKAQTLAEMLAPATTPSGKLAADIAASVDRTHDKVRGLSRGMLPIELEEGLLAGALEQLATATSGSSHIRCGFTCPDPDPVFDSRVSVHLYRIAQEAVTNALRHSGAQGIQITLDQEDGETVLRIEDDGTGLSTRPAAARGMGLRTMRYRAGLIGGKLEVGPGPRGGTLVVCRLAMLPPPENAELEK